MTADHELVRLDARTGRVTARVGLDGGPTSLVLADRHLWTVSPSDSAAYRVSLDGKDVTRVPVGTGPTALAVAPGSVWVANTLDGTVSRIDCDRAVVTRSFEAGAAPSVLAMTRQGLWVADGDQGAVRRVDPTTGRTTAEVAAAGPVTGIVAARGLLWLAGSDQPSAADHRGGTLHIAATVPRLDSIDPAIAAMVFPPQLLGMTNDGLVTFAHTTGAMGTRVVPDLATSLPTVSDHGRVYRFELRPGLTYSTGRPVLPGDIRRAIERDFRLDSPGAVSFAGIVGARRCSTRSCDLSQGIVVDARARSVTFHLRHADPDLIYQLAAADAFAVPAGTPTHDVGSHPVPATGPYRISEVRVGRSLTLTRNPRFHQWSRVAQPEGYPDRIVWRFGIGPQAAVTSVERGTADWALYSPPFSPPANRLREIVTEHASQVHLNPLPLVEYFALHTREPPFDRPLVRRAVNLAGQPRRGPPDRGAAVRRPAAGHTDLPDPPARRTGVSTSLPLRHHRSRVDRHGCPPRSRPPSRGSLGHPRDAGAGPDRSGLPAGRLSGGRAARSGLPRLDLGGERPAAHRAAHQRLPLSRPGQSGWVGGRLPFGLELPRPAAVLRGLPSCRRDEREQLAVLQQVRRPVHDPREPAPADGPAGRRPHLDPRGRRHDRPGGVGAHGQPALDGSRVHPGRQLPVPPAVGDPARPALGPLTGYPSLSRP